MVKGRNVVSIAFITILFTTACLSQTFFQSAPFEITYQSIIKKYFPGSEIKHISSRGLVVISENKANHYVLDPFRKSQQKENIYSVKINPRKENIFFNTNDRYLLMRKSEGSNRVLKIYDTIKDTPKIIRNDEGIVVSASVKDLENILYQVRSKNSRAKIYLITDNNPPVFVTDGIGEKWAPNGKFFCIDSIIDGVHQSFRILFKFID